MRWCDIDELHCVIFTQSQLPEAAGALALGDASHRNQPCCMEPHAGASIPTACPRVSHPPIHPRPPPAPLQVLAQLPARDLCSAATSCKLLHTAVYSDACSPHWCACHACWHPSLGGGGACHSINAVLDAACTSAEVHKWSMRLKRRPCSTEPCLICRIASHAPLQAAALRRGAGGGVGGFT